MTTVALICTRCSDEGHLIRVAPGRLAPVHLTRHDHQFRLGRLAPSGENVVNVTPSALGSRRSQRSPRSEGSDTPRGQAANAGPSPSTGAPSGAARARVSMPVDLERASGARGRRAVRPPAVGDVARSAGRLRPAAGASAE